MSKRYYTLAIETSDGHEMGGSTSSPRVEGMGGFGRGLFPPLFDAPEKAEAYRLTLGAMAGFYEIVWLEVAE